MANPKTKSELLELMANGYAKLNEQISKMSQEKAEQPFEFTCDPKKCGVRWQYDRCLRDIWYTSTNGRSLCESSCRTSETASRKTIFPTSTVRTITKWTK